MCRNLTLNTYVFKDSYTYLIIDKLIIVLVCFLEEFLIDFKSLRIWKIFKSFKMYFKISTSLFLFIFVVPGAVFDLQLAEVEATQIRITWKKPRQPNGIINQYRVKVLVSETGVTLENTLLTGKDEVLPFILHLVSPFCVVLAQDTLEGFQSLTQNT